VTTATGEQAKPRRRGRRIAALVAFLLVVGGGVAAAIVLTRDTTPPETERGTADVSTYGSTASFAFSSSEEDSTFECSLDGADWATCSSPWALQEVAAGDHALKVRATDGAGNLETSPVEFAFVVEPLPAPEVTAGKRTTTQVTLKWTAPPEGLVGDGYVVYRGSEELATLEGTERSFKDVRLTPDTHYSYRVALVEGGEEVASGSASASTVTPPLRDARAKGDFAIDIKVTDSYGWRDDGAYAEGKLLSNFFNITLKPKCRRGPCDVEVIHRFDGATYRGTLVREGTSYAGSWPAPKAVPNCNGGDSTPGTTITVDLRLKDAQGSDGEWRATEFGGTIRLLAPSGAGCVQASVSGTASVDVRSLIG
jgi:hypothetical protein